MAQTDRYADSVAGATSSESLSNSTRVTCNFRFMGVRSVPYTIYHFGQLGELVY